METRSGFGAPSVSQVPAWVPRSSRCAALRRAPVGAVMNPVQSPLHLPGPAGLSAALRCWGRSTSPASARFSTCAGRCSAPRRGGARRGTPEQRSGWGTCVLNPLRRLLRLPVPAGGLQRQDLPQVAFGEYQPPALPGLFLFPSITSATS